MSVKRVVVIVPAFNEEAMIGHTVTALREMTEPLARQGLEWRIFVVDDGSKDASGERAKAAGADRLIVHRWNQGLGAAVRTGLKAALNDGADIALKFDADLQHDPQDIPAMLAPILRDEADVVYGNRFERIDYRMPLVRRVGNRVFTALMRWLTGWPLRDSQPGIFAVNRDYLSCFYMPGNYNYTQQILVDSYRKGMRFAHVPVAFHKRVTGKSFISLKYPFKVLPQIFMVLVAVRPLKVFAPIGLLFLGLGLLLGGWEFVAWLSGHAEKPIVHVNAVLGLVLFGMQTLFFGVLAHLIVESRDKRP
ncbi:MAG: glycosyltransferase family 2 protein [Magnetococcales bacterium]|nr:glycosyltransferase family 2 protein [Magnetococcales bacterium]